MCNIPELTLLLFLLVHSFYSKLALLKSVVLLNRVMFSLYAFIIFIPLTTEQGESSESFLFLVLILKQITLEEV